MALVFVVQHGEKESAPGDPGLTARGRAQAAGVAERLRGEDLAAVVASPLLRARETAEPIAAACGLEVATDARLTERMNWDGTGPVEAFLEEWSRASADRDFTPTSGDSSRAAGSRFRDFLSEWEGRDASIAAVCHGGVTTDLLRTLLGDDGVPRSLFDEGVPSGAITVLRGLEVLAIASTDHLKGLDSGHRPA